MREPAKPAELKVLDRLLGKWRYEWESKPTEGAPKGSKGSGTTTNEWILDGWFQLHKGRAEDGSHEIHERTHSSRWPGRSSRCGWAGARRRSSSTELLELRHDPYSPGEERGT